MMNDERIRRLALALADVAEGSHMGHPDFRVNGRIVVTARNVLEAQRRRKRR